MGSDYISGCGIILITLFLIIYPKMIEWRDKRFKSYHDGLKPYAKTYLGAGLILCLLQLNQFHIIHKDKKELDHYLKKSTSLNDQSVQISRPIFQFSRRDIMWKKNEYNDNKEINICLENRGCRPGTADSYLVHYYPINENDQFSPCSISSSDFAYMHQNLINKNRLNEKCCLSLDVSPKPSALILELEVTYYDDITRDKFKLHEYFYWSNKSDSDHLSPTVPNTIAKIFERNFHILNAETPSF